MSLHVIRETAALYLQEVAERQESLCNTEALERFWRFRIGGLPHEVFQVAFLNSGYRGCFDCDFSSESTLGISVRIAHESRFWIQTITQTNSTDWSTMDSGSSIWTSAENRFCLNPTSSNTSAENL